MGYQNVRFPDGSIFLVTGGGGVFWLKLFVGGFNFWCM